MTQFFNIHTRFGPPWDGNLNRRAHGFVDFYRAFVAQIFGLDSGYPKTASLRASLAFQGATRIIPLSFLDSVALPGDYPVIVADNPSDDEAELQARYESNFPIDDLDVRLPVSGPPIVSTAATGIVRKDLCRLAAARAVGFDEIAVRILYV